MVVNDIVEHICSFHQDDVSNACLAGIDISKPTGCTERDAVQLLAFLTVSPSLEDLLLSDILKQCHVPLRSSNTLGFKFFDE